MRRRAVFSFLPSFFNNSTTPSSTTTSLSSPYPLHHTFFISNAKCQLNHLCFRLQKQPFSLSPLAFTPIFSMPHHYGVSSSNYQASRSYARDRRKQYDLFGSRKSDDKDSKKAWDEEANDDDDCLWTGSEDESEDEKDTSQGRSGFGKELRRIRKQAKEHSDQIDADDSDELRSIWSDSDEEKTLWTGDEGDSDADIPTEAHPNEASDKYIDKLFEFEEKPKYRTISELLKAENEPEELSPGKQARKLAVENALKKLKKGPDGRYINVWEVMSDLDILIGAFENIVSGPEYEELRQGGPKRLNMQFFKDIQAKMRDPNYKFSPELKLKPRSKLVPRKKWQKAQSRRRKAQKR